MGREDSNGFSVSLLRMPSAFSVRILLFMVIKASTPFGIRVH